MTLISPGGVLSVAEIFEAVPEAATSSVGLCSRQWVGSRRSARANLHPWESVPLSVPLCGISGKFFGLIPVQSRLARSRFFPDAWRLVCRYSQFSFVSTAGAGDHARKP